MTITKTSMNGSNQDNWISATNLWHIKQQLEEVIWIGLHFSYECNGREWRRLFSNGLALCLDFIFS